MCLYIFILFLHAHALIHPSNVIYHYYLFVQVNNSRGKSIGKYGFFFHHLTKNENVSGRRGLAGYVTNACTNIHVWNDWIASDNSRRWRRRNKNNIKWKITSRDLEAFTWKKKEKEKNLFGIIIGVVWDGIRRGFVSQFRDVIEKNCWIQDNFALFSHFIDCFWSLFKNMGLFGPTRMTHNH